LKVSASLSANVGKMKLRQMEIKTNSLKRNGRKKSKVSKILILLA
jgi:hypothetical protein